MTDQQINTAIAEACGWEIFNKPLTGYGFAAYAKSPNGDPSPCIPNYCADLNAMHEAEKVLISVQHMAFDRWLQKAVDKTNTWSWHATARQRAEAFLRTLGKWEEVQA